MKHAIVQWLKDQMAKKNEGQFPTVTTSDVGFRLAGPSYGPREIRWDDIVEIVAYKLDHWSYDVICLGFRVDGADDFIEVVEDFPGYKEFINVVESRFTLAEDWWRKVAFPAFTTNWTTIWKSAT